MERCYTAACNGMCIWCFEGSWTLYGRAKSSCENLIKSSRRKTSLKARAPARGIIPYNSICVEREFVIRPSCCFRKTNFSMKRKEILRASPWGKRKIRSSSERSENSPPSCILRAIATDAEYAMRSPPRRVHPAEKKTSGKLEILLPRRHSVCTTELRNKAKLRMWQRWTSWISRYIMNFFLR